MGSNPIKTTMKKDIRKRFRQEVFSRDKYICAGCGFKSSEINSNEELDAHHITDRNELPNGGYVKENGITLCKKECHMKAEKFHISGGKDFVIGFHPDDLYKKIDSSKGKALIMSQLL